MPPEATGILSLLNILKDISAMGVLGIGFWLVLDGRLVTRGHLNDVVAGKNDEIIEARAVGAEWKRLATRGTDDIIVPLLPAAREVIREQIRELRGGQAGPP